MILPLALGLLLGCSPRPVELAETPPDAKDAVNLPLQRFLWAGPTLPDEIEPGHILCRFAEGKDLDGSAIRRGMDKGWLQLGLVEVAGEELRLGGAVVATLPKAGQSAGNIGVVPALRERLVAALAATTRVNEACGTAMEPQVAIIAGAGASVVDVSSLLYTSGAAGMVELWLVVNDPDAAPYTPPAPWEGPAQPYFTVVEERGSVRVLSAADGTAVRGPAPREQLNELLRAEPPVACAVVAVVQTGVWGDAISLLDATRGAGAREVLLAMARGHSEGARSWERPRPTPGGALDWERGLSALPLTLPSVGGPDAAPASGACQWFNEISHADEAERGESDASGKSLLEALKAVPAP